MSVAFANEIAGCHGESILRDRVFLQKSWIQIVASNPFSEEFLDGTPGIKSFSLITAIPFNKLLRRHLLNDLGHQDHRQGWDSEDNSETSENCRMNPPIDHRRCHCYSACSEESREDEKPPGKLEIQEDFRHLLPWHLRRHNKKDEESEEEKQGNAVSLPGF